MNTYYIGAARAWMYPWSNEIEANEARDSRKWEFLSRVIWSNSRAVPPGKAESDGSLPFVLATLVSAHEDVMGFADEG